MNSKGEASDGRNAKYDILKQCDSDSPEGVGGSIVSLGIAAYKRRALCLTGCSDG